MDRGRSRHLSKSKFIAGLQCLKRLYLQVYEPELAGETDEAAAALMTQGHEVGLLAQRALPGGLAIDANAETLSEALERTRQLVADRSVPAIFEATFEYEGVLVRVDILERLPGKRWRLIEVKSSTGLKDHYPYDVAIQKRVVAGNGLTVASACLMHLNREYVYDGREHDVAALFITRDLAKAIRQIDRNLPRLIEEQRRVLRREQAPDVEPGRHCTDPVECEFYGHCHAAWPDDHVSYLPRIQPAKVKQLLASGIVRIAHIPPDFPLNPLQRRACDAVQTGRPWFSDGLRERLAELEYPLHFLDFETLFPAIPRFAGMRPYDHIPFQWSLDIQKSPGGALSHLEFLAGDTADPRRAFVESLCGAVKGKGDVVVYNRSFEFSRLTELARWVPQYAGAIRQVRDRLWDLLPVIRRHVYHPAFQCSFSIKNVLPALIPEMTYEGMTVADGSQAGLAWDAMIRGNLDATEKKRLQAALLAYCAQDTLAMVRLVEKLGRGKRAVGAKG